MAEANSTVVMVGRKDPRTQYKEKTVEGILSSDSDNAYEQRILYTIAASVTATSCANVTRDYIAGLGFRDEVFGDKVVNRYGLTANALLELCADDFSKMGRALIGVIYDGFLNVAEYHYIPNEFGRYTIPEEDGMVKRVAIYADWNCKKKRSVQAKEIKYLHLFNPDKAEIQRQMDECMMNKTEWLGQIFVLTRTLMPEQPLSPADPAFRDIETDGLIPVFRNRAATKGFMPNGIFGHPGKFQDDKKRKEFVEGLEKFQGAENSNAIILCEWDTPDTKPEWVPMTFPNVDKVYDLSETRGKENIREMFRVPPILCSVEKATTIQVGDNKQMEQAKLLFDEITSPTRKFFGKEFRRLFSANPDLGTPADLSIMSIGEAITAAGSYLFKALGQEAVDAVIEIVKDSALSYEQKIGLLSRGYSLKEEDINEAGILVKPTTEAIAASPAERMQVGTLTAMMDVIKDPGMTPAQKEAVLTGLYKIELSLAQSLAGTVITPAA